MQEKNNEETLLSSTPITYEEISKISNQAITRKAFLSLFKVSDLINYIKNSDNESVDNLRYVIRNVYHFSNIKEFYSADAETVKHLIDELKEFKSDSHTKDKIIEWFIELLEDVLKRLL